MKTLDSETEKNETTNKERWTRLYFTTDGAKHGTALSIALSNSRIEATSSEASRENPWKLGKKASDQLRCSASHCSQGRNSPETSPRQNIDMINNKGEPAVAMADMELQYEDGTKALDCINLTVHKGEFVTIIGPSGCGKSTLLRVAAGLEKATGGELTVKSNKIGFVFQEPALLPWRNVRENISLFSSSENIGKQEAEQLVKQAIEMVGLNGFELAKPHQLSGGMSMRVSIARALVGNPDLFLLDEPFGALDEFTREKLNDETQKLYVKRNLTGMFVTHSIPEAIYMGSRVILMGARPSRIIKEYEVPFDFPRKPEVRYSEQFIMIQRDISKNLFEVMT